jgi:hypothetical protein
MNETEILLSRLFNAAVGEPPNRVTVPAVRRAATRRRIVTCVSATAALAIAAVAGLAVSANAVDSHHVTAANRAAAEPRYYFEADYPTLRSKQLRMVVRATASGSIIGRVRCPGPRPFVVAAAADAHQTFFVACQILVKRGSLYALTGTRIYRFRVTRSGRLTGFRLLPGGNLAGLRSSYMGTTADGSELAIDIGPT